MKKSLIALAVASAVAAPAFAASSNVDVYGTLRYSLDHYNTDAATGDNWTINDQTSRFGIKGSEDLGGGLKAVWQIEQQIAATTAPLAGGGAFGDAGLRNTFIGVAGGFGTVIIGRHDTPYKLGGSADVFGDTSADSQKNGTGIIGRNGFDNRVSGTVAYVSPDFSGFHFAAAIVPGEGTANAANGLMDAYSLVGVYANGPLKVTLGYENFDKELGNVAGTPAVAAVTTLDSGGDTVTLSPAVAAVAAVPGAKDKSAVKFNIGYKIGDIGLGYTYERSKDGYTAAAQTDTSHLASITYAMGPITLAGQYGMFKDKQTSAADLNRTTLGAIYNLSKRTNVYAAYDMENYGAGGVDADIITMGVNHSF
jgi:predicted porin